MPLKKLLAEQEHFEVENEDGSISETVSSDVVAKTEASGLPEEEETVTKTPEKTKSDKQRDPRVKFMGVIGEVRKVQTKTGK